MWYLNNLQSLFITMSKQQIDMSFTNVSINTKTKERLKKHMKYGDSFDSIINDLLDKVEK